MSVTEILEQVKSLSPAERDELLASLQSMQSVPARKHQPKTGAEIVAMLEAMPPIELVDSHIEDPIEWVKAQRQKRQEQLKPYWDDESS